MHSDGTSGEIRNEAIMFDDLTVTNVQLVDATMSSYGKFVRLDSTLAPTMLVDTSKVDFVDGGKLSRIFCCFFTVKDR